MKILVNRLEPVLPKKIPSNQSAFVKGRSITDNTFLSQEALYSLEYRRYGKKFMAIKAGMEKAYDHMQWNFIQVMKKSRLYEKFINLNLIMGCITNPRFAILVMAHQRIGFTPRED